MQELVYVHAKQKLFLEAIFSALYKIFVLIAGRGSGKSSVGGIYLEECVHAMPGSSGFIGSHTAETISNRIIPSMKIVWEEMGYIEGVHYKVGGTPPSNFEKPKAVPDDYRNVISWYNGTVIYMISFFNDKGGRGANFQFGLVDEATLVKESNFAPNIIPALRGMGHVTTLNPIDHREPRWGKLVEIDDEFYEELKWEECPLWGTLMLMGSRAWHEIGKWVEAYQEKEEIKIADEVYRTFYMEMTALDNPLTGEKYVALMRYHLEEAVFALEIMNKKLNVEDRLKFYPSWQDKIHTIFHNPYKKDKGLIISWDFGSYTKATVWQEQEDYLYGIMEFESDKGLVSDVCNQIIEFFKDHGDKHIELQGDVNGMYTPYSKNSNKSIHEVIIERLSKQFSITPIQNTHNPPHTSKYEMLNDVFAETFPSLPKIRIYAPQMQKTCISIKLTKRLDDGSGRKDKRSEHPLEKTPQKHATHGSDTVDYVIYNKYKSRWIGGGTGKGYASVN